MSPTDLTTRIRSIEAELAVLKASARQGTAAAAPKSFADLYGTLAGKMSATEEDLEAAAYRFDWEGKLRAMEPLGPRVLEEGQSMEE